MRKLDMQPMVEVVRTYYRLSFRELNRGVVLEANYGDFRKGDTVEFAIIPVLKSDTVMPVDLATMKKVVTVEQDTWKLRCEFPFFEITEYAGLRVRITYVLLRDNNPPAFQGMEYDFEKYISVNTSVDAAPLVFDEGQRERVMTNLTKPSSMEIQRGENHIPYRVLSQGLTIEARHPDLCPGDRVSFEILDSDLVRIVKAENYFHVVCSFLPSEVLQLAGARVWLNCTFVGNDNPTHSPREYRIEAAPL